MKILKIFLSMLPLPRSVLPCINLFLFAFHLLIHLYKCCTCIDPYLDLSETAKVLSRRDFILWNTLIRHVILTCTWYCELTNRKQVLLVNSIKIFGSCQFQSSFPVCELATSGHGLTTMSSHCISCHRSLQISSSDKRKWYYISSWHSCTSQCSRFFV